MFWLAELSEKYGIRCVIIIKNLNQADLLFAGKLLLKRLLQAIPKADEARRDFTLFDSSLRVDIPEEVASMEADIKAWELDKSLPDPYRVPKSGKLHSTGSTSHHLTIS